MKTKIEKNKPKSQKKLTLKQEHALMKKTLQQIDETLVGKINIRERMIKEVAKNVVSQVK